VNLAPNKLCFDNFQAIRRSKFTRYFYLKDGVNMSLTKNNHEQRYNISSTAQNKMENWFSIPKKIILLVTIFGIIQFSFSFWNNLRGPGFTHFSQGIELTLQERDLSLIDNQRTLVMSHSEESNYIIARNKLEGHGYTHFDSSTNTYKPFAFHSSFTVFLYEALISSGLDFDIFIILYFLVAATLHSISLLAIFQILRNLGQNYAVLGLCSWALFPPTIYFINPLFLYESICTAAIIIIYERIHAGRITGYATKKDLVIIIMLSAMGVFFRLTVIPILLSLFMVTIIFPGKLKRSHLISGITIIIAFISIMCLPVLEKNQRDFGSAVLSTQMGFVLWEGSNPIARGSWDGSGKVEKLGLSSVSNIENLNQLEISHHLRHQALEFAFNHPLDYFVINLRKLAIFFLPQNYGVMPGSRFYNPINAIVYISFLIFTIGSIFRKKDIKNTMVLISPILASITLTLIFIVGYRWRFYAEPFMIICMVHLFYNFMTKRQKV